MIKGYIEPDNPAYQAWVDEHVPENAQQWCVPKAKAMAEEFPELRVVGVAWMDWGHAWCVNAQDEVVDPTAHQFGKQGFNYTCSRLEVADFPGKCQYCREYTWADTPGVRAYLGDGDYEVIGPHTHCYEMFKQEMIREEGKEQAALILGE
jgi:hypothetical protein